ncbi:MAG: hypothetical protein ACTSV5_07200, partial [Promethearchaeota archaeon]
MEYKPKDNFEKRIDEMWKDLGTLIENYYPSNLNQIPMLEFLGKQYNLNRKTLRKYILPNFKDKKNLRLSYKSMKAELGISIKFNIKLKDGSFLSKEILETLFKKFSKWHLEDLGDRVKLMQFDRTDPSKSYRYNNYYKVLNQILNYAKIRGIDLFDGTGSFTI